MKLFLPGITDTATLRMASELCGQAAFTERIRHHGRWGESQHEDHRAWHDVLTADMIRQLPAGHALVIRGSLAPVIARLGVAWKDRAYKAARRSGTAVAPLRLLPLPAGQAPPLPPAPPAWPARDGDDDTAGPWSEDQ